MKILLQFLLFFLTSFNLSANPPLPKVALPNYTVSFPKTENNKLESELKIGVSNFARSGISDYSFSQKAFLQESSVLENRTREVNIRVVQGAGSRLFKSIDDFKTAIAKGDNVFYVGKHSDITPRPTGVNGIAESHHGVNSVWMKEKYIDYGTGNNAPTVYMLKNPNHNATRGEFNKWATEIRAKQGASSIDYSKVSEQDMIDLANRQFDVADVPQIVRDEYFKLWNDYKLTLMKEMDKETFDKYELGLFEVENLKKEINLQPAQITRKDKYWYFMKLEEMTAWNDGAFKKAIKEFGEKQKDGKNVNETSEDNLFLDSDFYIRTMTRWLFQKYFQTVGGKTPKGDWKLAVAMYNGGDNKTSGYVTEVYGRVDSIKNDKLDVGTD
ncbi:hypothetical protein BH10BAC1_BH10BAC1_11770 [soil metagenome]